MNVYIRGKNKKITLSNRDFIAEGGEGKIFSKDDLVFKIYNDTTKVISHSKISELAQITNSNVVRPKDLLLDSDNKPIGYTMDHVRDTYSLCQLFPKIFRDREGLDNETVLKLVQRMQSTVKDIHKKRILIVDFNEVNFLVNKAFNEVFFIDVDSYQTPNFPATAISPNVRDWTNNSFNEFTDWFSFGVIAFQMFIGIHPFRGKYEQIKYPKDKLKELQERIIQRIPVFHRDVRFPSVCLPFDVIPEAYKSWFKAMFFEGKRLAPPSDGVEVIIVPVFTKEVASNKDFEINVIYKFPDDVIKFISKDGTRVTITKKEVYRENDLYAQSVNGKVPYIAILPRTNKIIAVVLSEGLIHLHNLTDCKPMEYQMRADEIMSYDGRIYYRCEDQILELSFFETANNIIPSSNMIASVMPNSTQLFSGVAIQNIVGTYFISLFPKEKFHKQIKCDELRGFKIIDAKYERGVLFVIGSKKSKYTKFIFKFNEDFSAYTIRKVEDISYCGINFCVLDNGVVAHINEDEQLEIFSNKKDSPSVKVVDSDSISGNMKLFQDGVRVMFSVGKEVCSIKMKK